MQFPTHRERPFPHVGTTVPPSGDDSFLKRERRFPQVETAVTTSGNGLGRKGCGTDITMDRTSPKIIKEEEGESII